VVDAIGMRGDRAFVHTARSMIALDGDAPRPVPAATRMYAWMDDNVIATMSPRYEVGVLDLVTGMQFELPVRGTDFALAATAQTIACAVLDRHGDRVVELWDLRVPRDPAALRIWLGAVTNAKSVPGSDLVAWP